MFYFRPLQKLKNFYIENTNALKRIKAITISISLILFIIALTQPSVVINDFDGKHIMLGYEYFIMGGLAILGGGLFEWLTWLANPLYFIAVILFIRNRKKSIHNIGLACHLYFFILSVLA